MILRGSLSYSASVHLGEKTQAMDASHQSWGGDPSLRSASSPLVHTLEGLRALQATSRPGFTWDLLPGLDPLDPGAPCAPAESQLLPMSIF